MDDVLEQNPSSSHLSSILLVLSSFLIISWFSSLLIIPPLIRITRFVCRPRMKDELMDAQLLQLFDGWFSN